ncbi:MAG: helix-turn-helix transcriptional regulator [Polynucleobacter sp.]|uniref:helix-turn-helix domain-containing protein n=1 Tax=Polynucleobacter sp. TaxID=2029855 RepID=UPI002717DD2C|nr:helix-turn-helix transcriptional regulator [Polynucleobacter sp.]MDO8713991.1 helix-turn-helix transcriptional regulator [Polynucleobacter sp.]
MSNLIDDLRLARVSSGLTQTILAEKSGVSRMSIQKIESHKTDPKIETLQVIARALGMEIMLVPSSIRSELENFVRSGGKIIAQPAGIAAPLSIADVLIKEKNA